MAVDFIRATSTSTYPINFLMVKSLDHTSPLTGAAPSLTRSKNGAAFAAGTGAVTEIANGWYSWAGNTGDRDTLGELALHITATGGDNVDLKGMVVTSDVFAANAGLSNVTADLTKILGTAVSTPATAGILDVNAKNLGGAAQTGRDIGASVLLSAGTGAGQLDFTSGVVKANLVQIIATALTETSGQIAAAFKQFFNIASPTSTMNLITAVTTATTATNLTNAPTVGDFTAVMKTSLNAATPAVTVSDKTGFSLSAAGVQAIWDALTSALTTVGSIGKLLVSGGSAPTLSQIVNGIWDEPNASHVTAGTTGKNLSTAGSGADPLLNAVPGAYGVGTAGYDLGHIYSATQTTPISFVNPVNLTQTTVGPLVPGDDYRFADGFQLAFTSPYGSTNLVGGSVVYKGSTLTGGTLPVTGTIVDATHVYIELTAAQSAQLAQGTFSVEATLPTSDHVLTLAYGIQSIATVQGMPN